MSERHFRSMVGAAECTCTAWVGADNAVHVAACCPDHEAAVERAALELGEQLAIEVCVDEGGWFGALLLVILALAMAVVVLPFTGGARLPTSPRTPPVTVTTPTTPAAPVTTPPPVSVPTDIPQVAPAVVRPTASPSAGAPGGTLSVCPLLIPHDHDPLADPATVLEFNVGPVTVLTDVGTLEDDRVALVGCP